MTNIKYILINETDSKNPFSDAQHRDVPNVGHCIVYDASSKWKVSGSKERAALVRELCRLRKHYPETPILGMSELDTSSSHAPVRVSAAMNALRRELSEQ